MAIQDYITQKWVKIFGKKIDPIQDHWLIAPIGNTDIIKDTYIETLATCQNLSIKRNLKGVGLLNSINELGLDDESRERLQPKIKEIYEHTSRFKIDFRSEWNPIFKPIFFLLRQLFSKRLQQLNLPLSTRDNAKGLQSEIIKLIDSSGNIKWTIWYRKLINTGEVIFSGIYTQCHNPNYSRPLLKIIFPLPNGSATVFMTIKVTSEGALELVSNGKLFGDSGFYFTLNDKKGNWWAKFVSSMHVKLSIYINSENEIRADHRFYFFKIKIIQFHYKMNEKPLE